MSVKQILFFILTSITLSASAQKNAVNKQRVNVPGTKVFLIPPPLFHTVTDIKGLRSDTSSQKIEVIDHKTAYENMEDRYSRESMEGFGLTVRHYRDTIFHGHKGKIVCYTNEHKQETTNLLVIGDKTFCMAISGICMSADSAADKAIRQSILSAIYDKHFYVDPFYAAPFKINDSGLMFRFYHSEGPGRYFFSFHGEEPDTAKARAGILIIVTPNDRQATLKDLSDRTVRSLQMKEGTWQEVSAADTIVNGYHSREAIIHVTDNGYETMHYLMTMVNGKDVVTVLAGAANKYDRYVPQFRKFTGRVRFR